MALHTENYFSQLKNSLSIAGSVIIGFAIVVLMAHYVAAQFQPVRWPTRYYFLSMFFVALFANKRTAVAAFVFFLPLAPDFHLQLEVVLRPAVKYFVAHTGVDIVAGLCVGWWVKRVWLERKIAPPFERIHWSFGLVATMMAFSVTLAVTRNFLAIDAPDFSILGTWEQLTRFKLLNHPSVYVPLVDLVSYCFAILAAAVLVPYLKSLEQEQRESVIFVPLMWSAIFSACWGIWQSFSGLGLSQITLDYRPTSLGFGAQGFQPDIHAFAGIMLIGTIGILGFIKNADKREALLGYCCIGICWVALILSKSKTSFVLALAVSALFSYTWLRAKGVSIRKIVYCGLAVTVGLSVLLLLTKNLVWIEELARVLLVPSNWSKEKLNDALVYRPELFRAAWLMFADAPIFGVGQGNFFRLSADIDVSQSVHMAQKGGENAHNYFLQTLAETGIVGISVFCLVLGLPFFLVDSFSKIRAPAVAMLSIALANVYSHSLLIRPNLILLAVLLALMYASIDSGKEARQTSRVG